MRVRRRLLAFILLATPVVALGSESEAGMDIGSALEQAERAKKGYERTRSKLSDRFEAALSENQGGESKETLTSSQREWEEYVDEWCVFHAQPYRGGHRDVLVYDCKTDMSKRRMEQLEKHAIANDNSNRAEIGDNAREEAGRKEEQYYEIRQELYERFSRALSETRGGWAMKKLVASQAKWEPYVEDWCKFKAHPYSRPLRDVVEYKCKIEMASRRMEMLKMYVNCEANDCP